MTEREVVTPAEWRWVVAAGLLVVASTCVPYVMACLRETPERTFGGCILLVEDCYSYLAKMRQGADGAWLFHIPYTPERHPGSLFFISYLLLGKIATLLPGDDLTKNIVVVYHLARVAFGMGLLLTVYRFLAVLTGSLLTRRLAWMMVAWGGGLGWLLTAVGRIRWLGDLPLDLYFPEGFAFIALLGFPHVAAAQSLLLAGFLCLLHAWRTGVTSNDAHAVALGPEVSGVDHSPCSSSIKWAALTGLVWLLMGSIAPFYVPVAWVVAGGAWLTLCLRQRPTVAPRWREAWLAALAVLVSAPTVIYSAWVFISDPVYGAWAAQNQIRSPHPLHYLAAYGMPLALAAFAVRDIWRDEGWAWLAVSWVAVVPLLSYLPVNVQLRLTTGIQVPLSLLAAQGAVRLWRGGRRWLALPLVAPMIPTNLFLLASSSVWMMVCPSPSFRDTSEIAALDWLATRSRTDGVVLTAYETGAYLPVRVNARALVGHDLEAKDADRKRALVDRFFDATEDDEWRQRFLAQYSIDYVLWGPPERNAGEFDPNAASYLQQAHKAEGYVVFSVEP